MSIFLPSVFKGALGNFFLKLLVILVTQNSKTSLFCANVYKYKKMNLTLELLGFPTYLKQPTGKIYPLLEYTDFQGTVINNTVV